MQGEYSERKKNSVQMVDFPPGWTHQYWLTFFQHSCPWDSGATFADSGGTKCGTSEENDMTASLSATSAQQMEDKKKLVAPGD
jgi:hypothetical protein